MNFPLLLLVTGIYVAVAVNYWFSAQRAMALVFAGYAVANVGLILASRP